MLSIKAILITYVRWHCIASLQHFYAALYGKSKFWLSQDSVCIYCNFFRFKIWEIEVFDFLERKYKHGNPSKRPLKESEKAQRISISWECRDHWKCRREKGLRDLFKAHRSTRTKRKLFKLMLFSKRK